jgi:hypothetical protein
MANHRLSGRCWVSCMQRTPTQGRVGWTAARHDAEALRAKAQKVLSAAFRSSVRVPLKPRVAIELRNPCFAQARSVLPCTPVRHMCRTLGHPSNACVRPRDGSTPARNMTSRDHLFWQIHLLQKRLVPRIAFELLHRRVTFDTTKIRIFLRICAL